MLWWAKRLSANRRNIGDAANMVRGAAIQAKNMPRQQRFKKAHNRTGFDLVETPVEAATALMIMIARAGKTRRIEDIARQVMETQLTVNMQLSADDADGMVRQIDSWIHNVTLPESAISPMTKILHNSITRDEAADLAAMLDQVACADGEAPDINHSAFLRAFREGFDLN